MDHEINQAPVTPDTSRSGGNCAAGDDMTFGMPLAMVYAPCQPWRNLYEPDKALKQGTLFADLDLPFLGSRRGEAE